MGKELYAPERALDSAIKKFQLKLGIVDEGAIVDDSDYEESHEVPMEEVSA